MTNKRYTDEEIIKALGCCLCDNSECLQCQNKELCRIECDELAVKAIDHINRQNAEIDMLNKKVEELSEVLSDTIRIRYAEAKTEAIKEFADRLMKHKQRMFSSDWSGEYQDDAVRVEIIESILKEMSSEE